MKKEKRKFKKKEKKKNGWSKKTTRNCFFNEHFNIENDSGTLQNSATNNWKQQTEKRKYFWSKKQLRNTTGRTTRISCWEICGKLWLMVWNTTILHFTKKLHCNIMGKHFALLLQFLIKKLKKRNIIMQFSVLGNNNYTINEQEHKHHWSIRNKTVKIYLN